MEVKVISGDNAASVGAVTAALGLGGGLPVDARELRDPDALSRAVEASRVFGRVTPHQKRAMVNALQRRGHTVAMTGDGVNDVLALKDADLGVAMGSGSPATRAVAKIVLLDDAFATLPHVVAEGRRVIGNIERVANLFLTKTVYSAVLALLVVLWQAPFPFKPIHVTITGWFTIGIPAFLLSLAPNHERARPGFVRRVFRLGLPAGVVIAAASFGTYLLVRGHGAPTQTGVVPPQEATAALAALIVVRRGCWPSSRDRTVVEGGADRGVRGRIRAHLHVAVDAAVVLPRLVNQALMRTGLLMGAAGAVLIEALWWFRSFAFGEPRVFWRRPD